MGHRLGGIKTHSSIEVDCEKSSNVSMHTPTLFKLALFMISTASDVGKSGQQEQHAHPKQVKVVRKTGISLLLHLSSAPGVDLEAFWTADRVASLQREVLQLNPLTAGAAAAPGHLVLKLALAWSESGSEYLVGAMFTDDLLEALVNLLQEENVTKQVAKIIVQIVTNLIFSPGSQRWYTLKRDWFKWRCLLNFDLTRRCSRNWTSVVAPPTCGTDRVPLQPFHGPSVALN